MKAIAFFLLFASAACASKPAEPLPETISFPANEAPAVPVAETPDAPEFLEGCPGKNCGRTTAKRTSERFALYRKMSKESKVVGRFRKGTRAKPLKVVTKVVARGQATVIRSEGCGCPLKKGDSVNTVFELGDGLFKARLGETWVEFDDTTVKLHPVEPARFETWTELAVGRRKGYAEGFPFAGAKE